MTMVKTTLNRPSLRYHRPHPNLLPHPLPPLSLLYIIYIPGYNIITTTLYTLV